MLTLTRKVGERIRIGDDIVIVVKEIRRNQIRIGIIAPREIPVMREEVWIRALEAKAAAADAVEPADLDETGS